MVFSNDKPSILNNPAFWISILSALAALLSAGFSYWSARTAKRMLGLAEGSELRRQPQLIPHFGDGYCKVLRDSKRRVYVFAILINNPTDSGNSVTRIELQVGYTTDNYDYVTLKLPHANDDRDSVVPGEHLMRLPAGIDAHGCIAGSVIFYLDDELIQRNRIDDLKLLVTDTHDQTSSLETSIIRDIVDAKEAENSGVGD